MFKLKKLNAIIAIEIIISMILYYFLVVGYAAVSYAIDIVETNNHNVDFSAYFINSNGEKVDSVEKFINEEEYLYVDVTIKNEGFFNGTLNLSNNNFNIKQEILSENIEQINGNEIKLKQINAGATETIKLALEPVKDNEILKSVFYGKTNVNLSGKYVNSKNIENGSFDEINGTTSVGLVWKATDEILSDLETTILTNKIYENSKRIVQILVNSSIKNNDFPIGKNILNLNVPENVQEVKVFARQTNATNPKLKFSEANYKYDKTNHTLNIQIENNDENTIFWNKNSKDTFIVTYIFDKDYDVTKDSIKVDSSIFTYDNKEIKNSTNININEEKDGVVTNELLLKENSIFKGKLYTGEEREFTTYSKTYINNTDYVEKIVINENEAKYLKNEELINANILYKSISINKQEFLNLFGENGYITIKDETGVTIGNISKNSTEDENGNIKLNFSIGKKSLKLETSKPILEGTLNIENIKSIQNTETSREFVNDLTGIKEELQTNYNDKIESVKTEKTIELKNTVSKASLECTSEKIICGKNNEQIELIAKLNTLGEEYNLYKNPQIEIILPKEMENVSLNQSNILYKNGLTIQSSEVIKKEDGRYAILIKCEGEQEKYSQSEETEMHIYIGQTVKNLEQDYMATIEMNCFNENDATSVRSEKNITLEKNINNSATENKETESLQNMEETQATLKYEPKEVLYNISAIKGVKELTENDSVYEQETVKYKLTIKNNTDEDYENINVKAIQQNGKMWDIVKEPMYNPYSNITQDEDFYRLTDSNERSFDKIEKLKSGDSVELIYDATADYLEKESEKLFFTNITISSDDGKISKELKTVENKIENSKIDIKINQTQSNVIELYEDMGFPTRIDIKNHNENEINNIVLKVLFSKNLKYEDDVMELGDFSDRVAINSIDENNKGETIVTLNISKLEGKEQIEIYAVPRIGDIVETKENIMVIAQATLNANEKYYSNQFIKNAKDIEKNISIEQKVYLEEKEISESYEVPNESKIKIVTIVTNNNKKKTDVLVENHLPDGLHLETANVNIGNGKRQYEITKDDIKDIDNQEDDDLDNEEIDEKDGLKIKNNTISIEDSLESGQKMLFNIEAKVDTSEISVKQIENELNLTDLNYIISYNRKLAINTDKKLIVEDEEEKEIEVDDEEILDDNAPIEEESKKDDNDIKEETKIIGKAWLDKNKNGIREDDESTISGIRVRAKNMNTGDIIDTSLKTGKDGAYELNVSKGKYIVLFDFDTDKYRLTTYQANGASDILNSDVILKEIEINGEKQTVAATDELMVEENVSNIDIGLIEKEKFDLKLNKYISKISISNNQGQKSTEYNDTELAKVEIKAKYLSGTTVAMEYKIKVTNEGDIPGYAKQIVDYKPQDLEFNSSINSGWYQNGNDIYNDTLKDTLIKPGETKEVTLVLTKTMTENNVGLINNLAEIAKDYNDENTSDINSIPGNKQRNENDLGQANVIISVSTGALINYLLITFTISGVVTLIAIYIGRKIFK